MEISFTICERLSTLIEEASETGLAQFPDVPELQKTCLTTLDVLWELHRFIDVSGSEEEFWANEISKTNFNKVMSSLQALLK